MDTMIINPLTKGKVSKMKKKKGKKSHKKNPAKTSSHGKPLSVKSIISSVKKAVSGGKKKKGKSGKKKKGLSAGLKRWQAEQRKKKKGKSVKKSSAKKSTKKSSRKIGKGRKKSSVVGHGHKLHRPRLYEVSPSHYKKSEYSMIPAGVMINPLLKGKHKKGKSVKKSKRKRGIGHMKNPLSMSGVKDMVKDVPEALYAGAGLLGVTAVMNVLPATIKTNDMYRVGGKIVATIGLGMLVKMITKKPAVSKMVVLGGTLNILNDVAGITKLSMFLPVETKQIATTTTATNVTEQPVSTLIDDKTLSTLFE